MSAGVWLSLLLSLIDMLLSTFRGGHSIVLEVTPPRGVSPR